MSHSYFGTQFVYRPFSFYCVCIYSPVRNPVKLTD